MDGQRFCGVEDEDRGEVIFFQLSNTCHSDVLLQFVPIVLFQIQKLSDAMHIEDKEEGLAQLREVLAFLHLPRKDPPEISNHGLILLNCFSQISSTSVNENGSLIQDAVRGGKTDFVRLLLEHG